MVITCDTTRSRGARGHSYPQTGLMLLSAVVELKLGKAQLREKVATDERRGECPDAYELTNVCFGCWEWSSIVGLKKHQNTIQGRHPVGGGERRGPTVRTQAASTALRLSCWFSRAFSWCSTNSLKVKRLKVAGIGYDVFYNSYEWVF